MGCPYSTSKEAQEQREIAARRKDCEEVQFSASDIVELQSHLWNVMVLAEGGPTKREAGLAAFIETVQRSVKVMGYTLPTNEELACRLLTDTVERECGAWDAHFVYNLQSEEEVLALLMDNEIDIKQSTLEVLLQWYTSTTDCAAMLEHVMLTYDVEDESPTDAGYRSEKIPCSPTNQETPKRVDSVDSLLSFVWKGSPDLSHNDEGSRTPSAPGTPRTVPPLAGSPVKGPDCALSFPRSGLFGTPNTHPSFNPHTTTSLRSTSFGGQSNKAGTPMLDQPSFAPLPFMAEFSKNTHRQSLRQLAFALRGAMRSALRRYSTSGHDELTKKQRANSQQVAGAEWSRDKARAIRRCGSLSDLQQGALLLPPGHNHALTVILDLDETLVYARHGPLWVRPGVPCFLAALKQLRCEVVCWTASNRSYAGGILSRLDPLGEVVSQCIYSHPRWLQKKKGPQTKNLQLIGRDLDRTIIIDNLPDAVAGNEKNAIVVENYEGCELHDTTLTTLTKVIKAIIDSRRPVPEFLQDRSASAQHLRYGERTLANGTSIYCYMLNSEPSEFSLPL